ncbi:MAG: hypothetical protein ACLP22_24770, partial [Solirubrobacteraceae bacterium]
MSYRRDCSSRAGSPGRPELELSIAARDSMGHRIELELVNLEHWEPLNLPATPERMHSRDQLT